MNKGLRRLGRMILMVLCAGYIALIVLAFTSDSIIFQPHASDDTDATLKAVLARLPHPGQLIRLQSGQQTITAFYLPNPNARFTLLFSHGNAEDIGDDMFFLQSFYDAGFSVMAYDYRGYGTSTGKPSEQGVYEDVFAAYDYLTQQLHVPANQVIAMGRSLGCAAAVHLSAGRPVAGLVIEAPFLSAFRVLTRVQVLPWDKFNNARDIRKVHVPVMIVHGRNDQIVPFWHGEKLYRLANEPKTFLPIDGAGHNDVVLVAGKKYVQSLRDFTDRLQ
jgi:abhydrolase domain-containing protein 17